MTEHVAPAEAMESIEKGISICGRASTEVSQASLTLPSMLETATSSPVPAFLCVPPRAMDQDCEWGLGTEVSSPVEPSIAAKITRLHELKAQGTHLNAARARNRSFHNPNIYAKLVSWTGVDEHGSNSVLMARAQHAWPPAWDPKDPDILAHGVAPKLLEAQKRYTEERTSQAAQHKRTRIEFASHSG